ncbi:uroporphyrinogen-III synthase [Ferrimonas senticii]|uniref:uroporphyrinogen-III synthase n=1 Tax=Ferrimonas senticii TaxID=394566 RepID=UPI00040A4AFF|nr:uroporphyrinogen-III synthase [Ferrimonas senticii]
MHILLTRPVGRNEALAERLQALGHLTTIQPMVVIEPRQPQTTTPLQHADAAFFVSKNAVELADKQLGGQWPSLPCFAVGGATAKALRQCGANAICPPPDQETSEGVLALSQWQQFEQADIVIVGGEGGRTFMAETLQQQGHRVHSWVLYQRRYPPLTDNHLRGWQQAGVDAILATSGEIFTNFFEQLPESAHPWLQQLHWLLPVPRLAQLARQHGCHRVSVIGSASDDAVINLIGTLDTHGAETPRSAQPK